MPSHDACAAVPVHPSLLVAAGGCQTRAQKASAENSINVISDIILSVASRHRSEHTCLACCSPSPLGSFFCRAATSCSQSSASRGRHAFAHRYRKHLHNPKRNAAASDADTSIIHMRILKCQVGRVPQVPLQVKSGVSLPHRSKFEANLRFLVSITWCRTCCPTTTRLLLPRRRLLHTTTTAYVCLQPYLAVTPELSGSAGDLRAQWPKRRASVPQRALLCHSIC